MVAITFRQRLRAYVCSGGDVPPTPEWFDGVSRSYAVLGTLVVILVGMAATAPFVGLYLVTFPVLPLWVDIAVGIGFFVLARLAGTFLGGPVADSLLGIPREVPGQ